MEVYVVRPQISSFSVFASLTAILGKSLCFGWRERDDEESAAGSAWEHTWTPDFCVSLSVDVQDAHPAISSVGSFVPLRHSSMQDHTAQRVQREPGPGAARITQTRCDLRGAGLREPSLLLLQRIMAKTDVQSNSLDNGHPRRSEALPAIQHNSALAIVGNCANFEHCFQDHFISRT